MASFDYMGVYGRDPEQVLRALGYREGQTIRYPGTRGDSAGRMGSGWFLLFGYSVWTRHAEELSEGCQAICVEASDTAMSSRAIFYEDGRMVWSVAHNDDPGRPFDVRTEGTLPPEYDALYAEFMEKQRRAVEEDERVDYLYDLPLEVAGALTGYVPCDPGPHDGVFVELAKVEPAPASTPPSPVPPSPATPERPWWKFW